jgi:glycosyltransferase involved in cell wall biosynthesis
VSVVIPTFNGKDWLEKTIKEIEKSLVYAKIKQAEIVIIDDGSTDNTFEVAKSIKTNFEKNVYTQKNQGRFEARKAGTKKAKYDYILFVDTRVFIGEESLAYILKNYSEPDRAVWCSHVRIDKIGNIYARFWEAVVFIAWRKYFSNPRDISYGLKGFDDYPKGTTCFFVPKKVMKEANDWFETKTHNPKASNDDTLLLRKVAETSNINISPEYWCTYHARTAFKQYVKHVYHRGKVFVDGFFRLDGNKYVWVISLFLMVSLGLLITIILRPHLIPSLLLIGLALWALEFVVLLFYRLEFKDMLSLFILTPVFILFYGLGIWNGFLTIVSNKLNK